MECSDDADIDGCLLFFFAKRNQHISF